MMTQITEILTAAPQHTLQCQSLKGLICFNFPCSPWFSRSSLTSSWKKEKKINVLQLKSLNFRIQMQAHNSGMEPGGGIRRKNFLVKERNLSGKGTPL